MVTILALLPAIVAHIYFSGQRALILIGISMSFSILSEALFLWIGRKPIHIGQGSAIITGLLIGLIVPKTSPLWLPAIGSFFAIGVIKHAFGGSGMAVFNPAASAQIFYCSFQMFFQIHSNPQLRQYFLRQLLLS
jgi:electron transport complex protein RnfD